MSHWCDFQSVSQLAAALNAAFFTLTGFLGNSMVVEEKRLRRTISRLLGMQADSKEAKRAITELRLFSGEGRALRLWFENNLDLVFRPLCVCGMVAGLTVLIMSSFWYQLDIPGWAIWVSMLALAPFSVGVVYAIAIIGILNFRVSRKRRAIENNFKLRAK